MTSNTTPRRTPESVAASVAPLLGLIADGRILRHPGRDWPRYHVLAYGSAYVRIVGLYPLGHAPTTPEPAVIVERDAYPAFIARKLRSKLKPAYRIRLAYALAEERAAK